MMTAVLVDSNVLLDLMTEDTRWLRGRPRLSNRRLIAFASLSTR
jgi:hypothetical protein